MSTPALKTIPLKTIAETLGGSLAGDAEMKVGRLVHPRDAANDTDIILAFDKSLHGLLENTPAKAVVLAKGQDEIARKFVEKSGGAVLVDRPRYAMAKLTALFARPDFTQRGIHPSAVVDPTARIGKNVAVGPLCYVGPYAEIGDGSTLVSQVTLGAHAVLGKDCLLYAGARIGDFVQMGDGCIIHFNCVIGSDGFSFVTPEPGSAETAKADGASTVNAFNNEIHRIHSLGAVILGHNVEIGANTAIDRGTITHTRIGNGTKIDNQVQIGHNVEIGENGLVCGGVGIAGSSTIGDRVVLAARAGVADHVKVGNDAVLMAAAQLGNNLPDKQIYMGFPAMPRERFMDQIMLLARSKNLIKRISDLEEKVNKLESPEKKD